MSTAQSFGAACLAAALMAGATGSSFAADAGTGTPALRTTVTPAGLMLELPAAASAPASARPPATTSRMSDQGMLKVLPEPASPVAARSLRAAAAAPATPALLAQPASNGQQVLVLPEKIAAPVVATKPNPPVIDIDPARPGTRATDNAQPDVLYRSKPVAAALAGAKP